VIQIVGGELFADNPPAEMVHDVLSGWWRAGTPGADAFSG